MCGRISCYLAPEDLSCSCKHGEDTGAKSEVSWVPEKFQSLRYVPSYNMGPRDTVVCIVAGSHFDLEAPRLLCPMMWGMIPPWHKEEYNKHRASTHNARLENVNDSKLYGKPLNQGKRCAVVINGFYEWKTDKKTGKKEPYYMYKKADEDVATRQQVLTLAGLFDEWRSPEGKRIYSCTILTTAANDVLSWLHHRAPVVLQTARDLNDWLDYKRVSVEKALAKLRTTDLSTCVLQWHPVASTVNNVRNKDETCIEPVTVAKEMKKTGTGSMSAWLKTGSLSNKRKTMDGENDRGVESTGPKAKSSRKD